MSEKSVKSRKAGLRHIVVLWLSLVIATVSGCYISERPEVITASVKSPYENQHTILIKACQTFEDACGVSELLRKLRINNAREKYGNVWLVVVGKYLSPKLAKRTLENLKDNGWDDAIVLSPYNTIVVPVYRLNYYRPKSPSPWPFIFFITFLVMVMLIWASSVRSPQRK